ncbi:hypothetical protein LXL04_017786 [Taraxacum kok-saghyz]
MVSFRHTNVMKYQIYKEDGFVGFQQSTSYPPSPPSVQSYSPPFTVTFHRASASSSSSGPKISSAVLFIIVILAVLFFISGWLHLLIHGFYQIQLARFAGIPFSMANLVKHPDIQSKLYDEIVSVVGPPPPPPPPGEEPESVINEDELKKMPHR